MGCAESRPDGPIDLALMRPGGGGGGAGARRSHDQATHAVAKRAAQLQQEVEERGLTWLADPGKLREAAETTVTQVQLLLAQRMPELEADMAEVRVEADALAGAACRAEVAGSQACASAAAARRTAAAAAGPAGTGPTAPPLDQRVRQLEVTLRALQHGVGSLTACCCPETAGSGAQQAGQGRPGVGLRVPRGGPMVLRAKRLEEEISHTGVVWLGTSWKLREAMEVVVTTVQKVLVHRLPRIEADMADVRRRLSAAAEAVSRAQAAADEAQQAASCGTSDLDAASVAEASANDPLPLLPEQQQRLVLLEARAAELQARLQRLKQQLGEPGPLAQPLPLPQPRACTGVGLQLGKGGAMAQPAHDLAAEVAATGMVRLQEEGKLREACEVATAQVHVLTTQRLPRLEAGLARARQHVAAAAEAAGRAQAAAAVAAAEAAVAAAQQQQAQAGVGVGDGGSDGPSVEQQLDQLEALAGEVQAEVDGLRAGALDSHAHVLLLPA